MTHGPDLTSTADICLILRSHSEHLWLRRQVLPTVRELEQGTALDEDARGAAMAYLEVLWIDAGRRAAETEGAFRELLRALPREGVALHEEARRLHATVRTERAVLATRVAAVLSGRSRLPHEHAVI